VKKEGSATRMGKVRWQNEEGRETPLRELVKRKEEEESERLAGPLLMP